MVIKPTQLTARSFYPNDTAKKPSWILIVLMFFFFFPAGIYFLHKRVRITKGRGSAVVITYTWSVTGAVMSILVLIGGGGIGCWISIAIFAFAFFYAAGDSAQWKSYDSYIALLMNGEYYLPNIADAVGKSQKDVVRHLEEMFDDGIFAGSYINMSKSTVEVNYGCLARMGIYAPEIKPAAPTGTETTSAKIVVRCKGCGANVEGVFGKTSTCEFCDSPIAFM